MADMGMVVLGVIAFWIAFPVVLRILTAVLQFLTETFRSAFSVLTDAVHNNVSRARRLWMEGRSSVVEALAYAGGSVWHISIGMQVVWTDLVLAAATVAGLISLQYSGSGVHYDLLLGVSCVGSALIFAETAGNLMGWLRTMPFATVERGRIPTFILSVTGFCTSIALLGALALYRSQMISEQADPTTVATWISYLPHWILVGMSLVFTVAAALAFYTIETFFITVAGLVCFLSGGVLGVLALSTKHLLFIAEFISKIVDALSDWWEEPGVVSDVVRALVDRLKALLAIDTSKQVDVIPPRASKELATGRSAPQEEIVPARVRAADEQPNEWELVRVGEYDARGGDQSRNNHRFEYPG